MNESIVLESLALIVSVVSGVFAIISFRRSHENAKELEEFKARISHDSVIDQMKAKTVFDAQFVVASKLLNQLYFLRKGIPDLININVFSGDTLEYFEKVRDQHTSLHSEISALLHNNVQLFEERLRSDVEELLQIGEEWAGWALSREEVWKGSWDEMNHPDKSEEQLEREFSEKYGTVFAALQELIGVTGTKSGTGAANTGKL